MSPAAPAPALAELIADGRWLAHRYDESNDTVQFRFVPREAHQALTFLTDQEIGDAPLAIHPRAECLSEAPSQALPTPRFIFHSAYCCSTLLARAFDLPGVAFGLKEPQILNDIAGLQMRRSDPRLVAAATDAALLLLARPLGEGEVNVIKPSNVFNPLIPLVIAMRPEVLGLLLHAPLETFIGSIARKEIEGRSWVRELMWKLINLGHAARFGFTDEEIYRHTDLQVGAVAWLAQQASFAEVTPGQSGFRSLDSATLVKRPAECMAALGELFEIDIDGEAIAAGPVFYTHSKDRRTFSADEREQETTRGEAAHTREIGITVEWAMRLAEHSGIAMRLPSPLLT